MVDIKNRVFAIEGIDGSGKATTAKLLAEQTGGTYLYCTDGNPLKNVRKLFDTKPVPMRFLYYLALPLSNFHRIEKMRQSSDVFVDRTIYSTIAYHKAYGLSEGWFKLIPKFLLNQFDAMLYFSVEEEERLRRLGVRQSAQDVMTASDIKSLEFGIRMDEEYRKIDPQKTLIFSTDNKSPQQVVDSVAAKLYN